MIKLLVIGSDGMLGSYAVNHFQRIPEFKVIESSKRNEHNLVDFNDTYTIKKVLDVSKPDIVLNCVGLVSLLGCENNPEISETVNNHAPVYLSNLCSQLGIKFIHISTDHFFGDDGIKKHKESDKVIILNQYAKSKFEAEVGIKQNNDALIIRAAILGRKVDENSLLDWMFQNLLGHQEASLLFNVLCSAIHCIDFVKIIEKLLNANASGLLNVGTDQVFSYGELYLDIAKKLSIKPYYKKIMKINDSVQRSTNRGLSLKKLKDVYKIDAPNYTDLIETIILEHKTF